MSQLPPISDQATGSYKITLLELTSTCHQDQIESNLTHQLTLIIHELNKQHIENRKKRTGKPEASRYLTLTLEHISQGLDLDGLISRYSFSADQSSDTGTYRLYLSDFWQRTSSLTKDLWPPSSSSASSASSNSQPPQRMILTNGKRHPIRPLHPPQSQLLYERYIPRFSQTFSLKVVDLEKNLSEFNQWHNSDRVNAFWGNRGTIEEHRRSLTTSLADDPHVLPVIGYFDETAFAYFELYYAAEDHIAPYADAAPYDRGFHALVGHNAFRGPDRVEVWISSVTQYLFLADARTQRVMLEPRVDNDKFLGYLQRVGYVIEKEFDFPHKRAALVSITREKFFEVQGVAT